ncbi:MAG: SgcQ protein, partial [Chloroflexi bacterium]|nr:SgcQ protein [Chloroflexota bacterium]
ANTGVNAGNLSDTLAIADGTVTGTAFKRAGYIWNEVDIERVRDFMRIAKSVRGD